MADVRIVRSEVASVPALVHAIDARDRIVCGARLGARTYFRPVGDVGVTCAACRAVGA